MYILIHIVLYTYIHMYYVYTHIHIVKRIIGVGSGVVGLYPNVKDGTQSTSNFSGLRLGQN